MITSQGDHNKAKIDKVYQKIQTLKTRLRLTPHTNTKSNPDR